MTDPVDRGRNRSETFAEFARAEGFSLSTFYKLKKLGLGPMAALPLQQCVSRAVS
jgi:hypothetical protein